MWFKKSVAQKEQEELNSTGVTPRMLDMAEDMIAKTATAYSKESASWAVPGSKYRDFEDCDVNGVDSKRSYFARCYEGNQDLFYKAVEEGRVPTTSHAYWRFYDTVTHMGLLIPRILKVLNE
ncbi:hypothetical protein LCGC14_2796300 [marine sediment metagenome]|uniref:Uncharacterized protein n=1 Tax=marine sediment metagenome TaxID=412755 RepID=A0A0F9AXQ4_9ZZZZ